ncbi:MAG: decaprenyl-phosphate phosphoribosyltransferase [Candidatus Krumholzibacteria bacterium]|nr:decaprenyl-phosphate phosphoribosyltransferase [Candidatus Krumholzibacteria bacterium]
MVWYIIVSMRPRQWTKNFVLFTGIVFSKRFFEPALVKRSLIAFFIYCLFSGAVYILNDVFDRKRDREHPDKKRRPIASGKLNMASALAFSIILLAILLSLSWFLGSGFFLLSVAFVVINLAYSFILRGIVILDVISISFSFLIRAAAGVAVLIVEAPDVELSPWLLICTLFLSLFLAFCKRRNEICVLESAENHRDSLKEYSVHLLDQLVGLSAATALISYSIYTVWPNTVEKFGTSNLVYTIPFVVFGIMRYLYLVYSRNEGGDPSGVLLTEKAILIDVFLWILATMLILVKV